MIKIQNCVILICCWQFNVCVQNHAKSKNTWRNLDQFLNFTHLFHVIDSYVKSPENLGGFLPKTHHTKEFSVLPKWGYHQISQAHPPLKGYETKPPTQKHWGGADVTITNLPIFAMTEQIPCLSENDPGSSWLSQGITKFDEWILKMVSRTRQLVGGWTNPFERYESKWIHLPQIGVNIKHIWNHHLGNWDPFKIWYVFTVIFGHPNYCGLVQVKKPCDMTSL